MPIKPDINTLRKEFSTKNLNYTFLGDNNPSSIVTAPNDTGSANPIAGQYADPAPFGTYKTQNFNYPKDVVQLDVYNDQDFYYETINDASSYTISGDTLSIDVQKELVDVGYESGDFRVAIRPLRHYLGSPDGIKLIVQDVSADRLEVRLVPSLLVAEQNPAIANQVDALNQEFTRQFSNGFFTLEKQAVLSNLYLFLSETTTISVNDYIQDRFTVRSFPYSIIFKLNEPLPVSTNVGSLVWISQELNPPITEPVLIIPRVRKRRLRTIKGPNFDIVRKLSAVTETAHRSWDDILSNPQTAAQTVRTVFTQSLVEGMQLNVDYRQFENFVKFSNAVDRIENFNYKVGLIENYYNLSSSITNTNASESIYVQAQVQDVLAKIDGVVSNFDGFERYMYFESSSYVTSSFGEFLDMAWPKVTSTKPHQLCSVTSSQVETWLEGIIGSASLYDNINAYALRKNVPEHIIQQQDGLVDSFVNMLGHFYDVQYEYINQLPKVYDRQESLTEGFAKELVYHIGASLGVNFGNGDDFEELWGYTLGLNTSGSFSDSNPLQISGEDRTREVWKRVINNLPLLLRTKGTERGIRALINCYGIPSTILRIREFGGPEMDFNRASQFKHDRFNYATVISGSSRIEIPYKPLQQSNARPESVELVVKLAPTSSNTPALQRIMRFGSVIISAVSGSRVRLSHGSTNVDFSSTIYDGTPHHVVVQDSGTSVDCYVTKNNYGAGRTTSGSISGVSFTGANTTLYIPTTSGDRANGMSGSIQELRYWTDPLLVRTMQAHAISPTSFFNDESTSLTGGTGSYYQLGARFTFGSDNKRINYFLTSSVSSSHPNQGFSTFTDNAGILATFFNYINSTASMEPWVETNYMEWPDIAGNRQISNKVRIESTVATSNQLFPNKQTLTSLQDLQPTDSPRLGVYLSPTDQINEDIAEQFGGISLDDYIGAYEDIYNEDYPKLRHLKTLYLIKAQGRYKSQNYIKLLSYYNGALFTLIKRLVPHRANLQTGLVIEPDILTRSKVRTIRRPQYEDEYYEGLIDLPSVGEPTADTLIIDPGIPIDIVPDANIFGNTLIIDPGDPISLHKEEDISASTQIIEPGDINVIEDIDVVGDGNLTWMEVLEPLNPVATAAGTYVECEVAEIDANKTAYYADKTKGTQYEFFTWVGPVNNISQYDFSTPRNGILPISNSANFVYVPSVDAAYSNPIGVTIHTARRSQILSPGDIVYKRGGDILQGQGSLTWATGSITYTGSYGQYPIASLGVRFGSSAATGRWDARTTTAPSLRFLSTNTLGNDTGYFTIPLPYAEDPDATYELTIRVGSVLSVVDYTLQFGSGSSQYSFTGTMGGLGNDTKVFRSKASNGLLYFSTLASAFSGTPITRIKLSILDFKGQFQEYTVGPYASLGLRNQKYNGCKMTSPDFNEDSPDTIDGGPVVTITEGPSTVLIVKPTIDGTYEFK